MRLVANPNASSTPNSRVCDVATYVARREGGQDGLDEATTNYVFAIHPAFEKLRDALGQLAGLMILAAAGHHWWRDQPLLGLAAREISEASDLIQSVDVAVQALHHHRHLSRCAALLKEAADGAEFSIGRRRDELVAQTMSLLRRASVDLQASSAALPGFDVVSLDGCCCCRA